MQDIAEQIRHEIASWEKRKGASISEQAEQIIVAVVSAITYDPHPGWRLPTGMQPWPSIEAGLREVQQDAIRRLPELLDKIAEKSLGGTTVNTFILLHSASTILDKICPFDKLQ